MKRITSVYDESPRYGYFKAHLVPSIRLTAIRCSVSIFNNFFLRQFIEAFFLPGRIPTHRVDHPLDKKIPFVPSWVTVYLDFVSFWLRVLAFLFNRYGRKAHAEVRDFIETLRKLYLFAAVTYRQNLSTTNRPFYIARPRFLMIHLLDPHLYCVPSLHVMVVVRTYTKFRAILQSLGEAEYFKAQLEEMKQGALAITQAILFIKQHSVNCIPAALYAMTCFDRVLFPPEEAEAFIALLFCEAPPPPADANDSMPYRKMRPWAVPKTRLSPEDIAEIKAHIVSLYRRFITEGETARKWEEPLLRFMRQMPEKGTENN